MIIDLFFARNEDAIGALDTKYGRLCQELSRRILNDDRDVQECVSDAYLGVWNAIPPQRPNPLLAFLCRLVRNISITRYHYNTAAKRSSQYEVALEELEHCLVSRETPESALEQKELTRLLEEFLSHLNQLDRVIFMRRYWFADSYAEIAARTNLREGSVSVRLSRVRKKFRVFLQDKEVFHERQGSIGSLGPNRWAIRHRGRYICTKKTMDTHCCHRRLSVFAGGSSGSGHISHA